MNGADLLKDCLPSIAGQSLPNIEIIVVDDGSTDGSVTFVRDNYPDVRLIINGRNLGFAKSINRGIREAKGDYLFLLNNDTCLENNCIEEFVRAIHSHEDEGRQVVALAPKMILDFLGRRFLDALGTSITRDGSAFNNGVGQIDLGQLDKPRRVFGACFGAAFFTKEAFTKVGLLDESYFAYYEDVDWNYRANILGYEIHTAPRAVVYHKHSATWSRVATYDKKYYFIHRNFLRTVAKNYYRGNMMLALTRRSFSHTKDALNLLRRRSYRRSAMQMKILIGTFLRLPILLTQNYMLNRNRKVQDGYIWSLGSPRIIEISSTTFEPSSYSPVLTLDVFEEISEHLSKEGAGSSDLDLTQFRTYLALHIVNMIWKRIRIPSFHHRSGSDQTDTRKGISNRAFAPPRRNSIRFALGPLVIFNEEGTWKILTKGRRIHTDQFLSTLLINAEDHGVEDLADLLSDAHPMTRVLNLKEEVLTTVQKVIDPLISIGLLRERGG
jgi:hypothetical protein